MKVLLDTCALLWAVSDPASLSAEAKELLTNPFSRIMVSAISCAEIACGVERKRISLDQHWKKWFRYYIDLNDWHCAAIDLATVEEAYSLPSPFHADPADRILVATARLQDCALVTADRKILDYPHVKSAW